MFDCPALLSLLDALAAELDARGVRGEMFIVDGAAMALAYNTRRATRDIDAVFEPKAVIYQAAERVATERGVDPNWLTDAVKGFLPGHDAGSTVLFEQPGLAVRVASPRYLLAMKVMAARVERDEDDIIRLAELSGTTSVPAILDVVQRAYPNASIPPRVQYFLEEILGREEPT